MKKITSLAELMEELGNGRGIYGFRGASEYDVEHRAEFEERGYFDCSFDLWDSRDCEYIENTDRLNGTSAIFAAQGGDNWLDEEDVKAAYDVAFGYAHNHHFTDLVYLVKDDHSEFGEDEHEVVLGHNGYGADIVAVVEL